MSFSLVEKYKIFTKYIFLFSRLTKIDKQDQALKIEIAQ
jgi:hypothetical protein